VLRKSRYSAAHSGFDAGSAAPSLMERADWRRRQRPGAWRDGAGNAAAKADGEVEPIRAAI
jgi:hypothetical protein